jgi:hypothetical protein
MFKTKYLHIFKNGKHIQMVTFKKDQFGWKATHFDDSKYLPFNLHDSPQKIKMALEGQKLTWDWTNDLDPDAA